MKNILILGASSDIGLSLLKKLMKDENNKIGVHCNTGFKRLKQFEKNNKDTIKIFQQNLKRKIDCNSLFKKYIKWSKNIDVLIQLNGKISSKKNWQFVEESDWNEDLAVNLSAQFFIAQIIFKR